MANELDIGVKFGAEGIPQVSKSISQLEALLKRFQKGLNDATGVDSIARLNKAIETTKERIKSLQQFTGAAGDKLGGGLVKGANQATQSLTNLSRIAQDAPFGFIGIANNINPLVESFGRLKAETGSTGGALKALGSSLLGAGGLGLAIGVGSALLTVFGDKLFGIGAASRKAKEDADELAKTIRDIGTIQAEAVGGVQGQIAQVNSLAAAVSDSNRPYAERKRALDELKDINKAYFGDLQLEDAATGKLTKTVEEYNKALVANAVVKAFVNEIANVSKAAITAEDDLKNLDTRLAQARKALQLARATGRPTGREGTGVSAEEARANDALVEAFKAQRAQQEKLLDLETQRALLTDQLNRAQTEALKFKTTQTSTGAKENDLLNEQLRVLEKIRDIRSSLRPERDKEGDLDLAKFRKDVEALAKVETEIGELRIKIAERDAKKSKLPADQIRAIVDGIKKDTQDKLNSIFQQEAILLEASPKIQFSRVELAPFTQQELDALFTGKKIGEALSGIAKSTKDIKIKSDRQVKIELLGLEFVLAQEEAKKAVERLQETIVNGAIDIAASTASSFGELISGIFSGQGIGNAFAKAAETLLSGIGGVLQEIGKEVIRTSALIKALKEALKTLIANPIAGIGIGLALVALGGALKSIKIPGFAGGVNNFSGGLALVGERGPELVNLPRGSDVIPNHMLNGVGAQTVTVVVEGRISGKDLVILGQRQVQSNKTTGGGTF